MALYRKYRPATFSEVVGQEHVTTPLSTALETGRINHAYLFSGPRGCGKTSSARILARSLNCEKGPTAHPCGVCSSCVSLGPGGTGNLDVTELDAASHGGVDDARELRDRAFFAPAESRFRVFIIDEAHMVTREGFNALLKIVEEPPEHLIFIFATTEPEKVLATIRSRTHHYPFRLLPPAPMRGLLERIVGEEGVLVEPAVYPLVIRAGGGSPRDSLSVMDQLLAGAGDDGVTYQRALALLGVTDVALIDDAVDALAAADHASLYSTIDRVIEAGHDPRRFAADLLERLRDLLLIRSVPDAAERGLVEAPDDVRARMVEEAQNIAPATLTRYAEVVHRGLGDMRGATNPRLLLEVMCARMLLPAADDDVASLLQRMEALERSGPRSSAAAPAGPIPSDRPVAGTVGGAAPAGVTDAADRRFVRPSERSQVEPPRAEPPRTGIRTDQPAVGGDAVREEPVAEPAAWERAAAEQAARETAARDRAAAEQAAREASTRESATAPGPKMPGPAPEPTAPEPTAPPREPEPAAPEPTEPEPTEPPMEPESSGGIDAADVRRVWAEIRDLIGARSKVTQVLLAEASILRLDGTTLVLGHQTGALAARLNEDRHRGLLAEVFREFFGVGWDVVCETAGQGPAIGVPGGGSVQGGSTPPASRNRSGGPARQHGGQGARQAPPQRTFRRPSAAARGTTPAPRPDSFSDGVPLPDEPDHPDDPGDGPGSRSTAGGAGYAGGVPTGWGVESAPAPAPAPAGAVAATAIADTGTVEGRPGADPSVPAGAHPPGAGATDGPTAVPERVEVSEDEMLAEAEADPDGGFHDHRRPEDIAVELLEKYLGAERIT